MAVGFPADVRHPAYLAAAVAEAQGVFTSPAAITLLEFLAAAKRGVCRDSTMRHDEEE